MEWYLDLKGRGTAVLWQAQEGGGRAKDTAIGNAPTSGCRFFFKISKYHTINLSIIHKTTNKKQTPLSAAGLLNFSLAWMP